MSRSSVSRVAADREVYAPIFFALGDETRLWLVARLSGGAPQSIAELTAGSNLTRQAVTKHLRVLEGAGLVRSVRSGRESRFEFEPASVERAKSYLDLVSEQWDASLHRLKAFVETEP